jgi:hypothetical protein
VDLYSHSPIRLHGVVLSLAQGQLYLYHPTFDAVYYRYSQLRKITHNSLAPRPRYEPGTTWIQSRNVTHSKAMFSQSVENRFSGSKPCDRHRRRDQSPGYTMPCAIRPAHAQVNSKVLLQSCVIIRWCKSPKF